MIAWLVDLFRRSPQWSAPTYSEVLEDSDLMRHEVVCRPHEPDLVRVQFRQPIDTLNIGEPIIDTVVIGVPQQQAEDDAWLRDHGLDPEEMAE